LDVFTLFNFASDRVPELARDIGGIQRPVIASPRGASFPIGQVTAEDQAQIPLQPVRPLVLRSSFQEEEAFEDVLGLGGKVDERLRDASARGREARLVFVDAREMAGACRLNGRYTVKGDQVSVTVNLAVGTDKRERFTVTGKKAEVEALVSQIVQEVEKRLSAKDGKP
jgi:hypothetical protein